MLVPLAVLWAGGAVTLFMDGRRRSAGMFALLVTLTATIAAGALLPQVIRQGPIWMVTGDWPPGIGIRLRADALGLTFAVLSLVVLAGALLFEVLHGVVSRTFPAVMLLLGAGMTGLFLTGDLFNFYVFFEIAMAASFILAAYGEEPQEVRAAVVFAVVNLVGSALFLSSIAIVYRLAGTLDMPTLASALERAEGTRMLVATLLFVAMGLKLGLFPFHFWLPAVYRGTRPVVAAVLSGAVANIGSYGLLRFGTELVPEEVAYVAPILIGIGAAGVVYGGVLATSRRNTAEVLGYSAIGQAGYVLIALAVGGAVGIAAAILYAAANALNKLVLFLTGGTGGRIAGATFVVGALSVGGLPPTVGFAGKVELFRMTTIENRPLLTLLVLVGSGLSLIYMFQAYQHRFLVHGHDQPTSPRSVRLVVAALAILLIAGGLWPEPLVAVTRAAASSILAGGS